MPLITEGYRGQRYEVRAKRPRDDLPRGPAVEKFVVGWTELPDGGALVWAIKKHPTWVDPEIVDLGEDEWARSPNEIGND